MTKSTVPSHNSPTISSSSRPAPATDTPSSNSQLTPQSGNSDMENDDNVAVNTIGRGPNLKKLQTDLPEDDGNEEDERTAFPGADTTDYDDRLDYEDEAYTDTPGRPYVEEEDVGIESYSSKSFTPEEEARVVKKFDRRLTLLMAFLYMLSFLDRSSEFVIYPSLSYGGGTKKIKGIFIYCPCFCFLTYVCCRHWKCKDSRDERRLEPLVFAIRMGAYGLLYHIYYFRMDDADV